MSSKYTPHHGGKKNAPILKHTRFTAVFMDAVLSQALHAAQPHLGGTMIGCNRKEPHATLAALNLPQGIHAQALKLLVHIVQAPTKVDCNRAADRAEGFGLGLEIVKALNSTSLEVLYLAFEREATARLMVLEQ